MSWFLSFAKTSNALTHISDALVHLNALMDLTKKIAMNLTVDNFYVKTSSVLKHINAVTL